MFSACLFCRRRLQRNEIVERFPVGRRLAFDPDKGRLWVVCTACGGWNLAPLDERLEIIEDCERRFCGARRRVATDNIALARIDARLDVVRIGRAPRREFAAWRYGKTLRQRRAQMAALIATTTIVGSGIVTAGISHYLFGLDGVYVAAYSYGLGAIGLHQWRTRARVDTGAVEFVSIREQDLSRVHVWSESGEPVIQLPRRGAALTVRGALAVNAARAILAWTNRGGGSSRSVSRAVDIVEARSESGTWPAIGTERTPITRLARDIRLAVEIASNEHLERLAMSGELAMLERAWRDAEKIAAIADDLLVPQAVSERLNRAKANG
jgi:hypothetical protein